MSMQLRFHVESGAPPLLPRPVTSSGQLQSRGVSCNGYIWKDGSDSSAQGVSVTIAPLGAVSAVLFTTPTAPAARKYNIFMAQIGCAAIGFLAFSLFGPRWLPRSAVLSASTAFSASLLLLFIDGAKLHHLNCWYALFSGAAGCILLCIVQEMVSFLKKNAKF